MEQQNDETTHAEAMIASLNQSRERMVEFLAEYPTWDKWVSPRIAEIDSAINSFNERLKGNGLRAK